MKSSWIGIGFSHHSVPSLSNTATLLVGRDISRRTCATNSRIARRDGPSRQLARAVPDSIVAIAARYGGTAVSGLTRTG